MTYLFQMVTLTNSIILTGSILGSIYLYVNRTRLHGLFYKTPPLKSILKNKNSDDKLALKNKVPIADELVHIDVREKPSLRKTRSVSNIYIEADIDMLTHFKFKDRLDKSVPNSTEMRYINEILKNTRNNSYMCSNPDCRDYISRKGSIYNAFDVQFCSEHCRNKVRNIVQHYWNC